ncbi:phosphatidate cytidylyltransferase [Fluviicola sp.]|uniref:phosphatidate cytidylyltransferase n=1 Tax=Fluviicola sp. TaxID=1917219 RepID=UPI0031DEB215
MILAFDLVAFVENKETLIVIGLIFGILVFATLLFWIMGLVKPNANIAELKMRTKSWWMMATIFVVATVLDPAISFVAIGALSFMALREIASISKNMRDEDRKILIWCYLAIPVQYLFAYYKQYSLFLTFIPIFMHLWIPFMLVLRGVTENIGRAMSVLPTQLMLTVFGVSHLAFLLSLPELEGFKAGGRGLLLFVVFITEMNDVFQFTWGKMFGRYKIIPKISPNKTWEGFIGGIITTTVVGYFLRFLTPFSGMEAILICLSVAITGFIGDVVVSAIKRDIGMKDTGNTIPGHGGILDRIDSLALTAPVFFHIVYNLYYLK